MNPMLPAILEFVAWESVLFAASARIAQRCGWFRRRPAETWLAVLAIEITLESGCATLLSFTRANSAAAYWAVAGGLLLWLCADRGVRHWPAALRREWKARPGALASAEAPALIAALLAPLAALSFKPVEEIDSINYLHYMIEWLANRATPYEFATHYVAFWELSFVPAWAITGLDLFFAPLALKPVLMMALALWLLGRELRVPRALLPWTVLGCIAMQHYWSGPSGVGTLKNDVLHGVGFVLMALALLRAGRRPLARNDAMLLAFGLAFGAVKYSGIFIAGAALALLAAARAVRAGAAPAVSRCALGGAAFFLLTSGHYYLHNALAYGSPFYPFQINLGLLHLPGTADLSDTSILHALHDPRLWRALFLPAGGLSPAGLLFPAVLAATLPIGLARAARAALSWRRTGCAPGPLDWCAAFLLCGWMLYFLSVYGASAHAGDLAFILNGLNSLRYVDGVLAASELFLVALLGRRHPRLAALLVALNLASRLALLYGRIGSFSTPALCALAVLTFLLALALRRRAVPAIALAIVLGGPFVVERNRAAWTSYWDDLKPALQALRGPDLALLEMDDGGYFAGHVAAAGNPLNTAVRALAPSQLAALAPPQRPRYLALLAAPYSPMYENWEARYAAALAGWGYRPLARGRHGGVFERAP